MSAGKENQDPSLEVQVKVEAKAEAKTEVKTKAKTEDEAATTLSDTNEAPPEPPKDPRLRRRVLPNPLIDDLNPGRLNKGVLIPLKTTQEVRQDHTIVQALITRAPTRCANDVLT